MITPSQLIFQPMTANFLHLSACMEITLSLMKFFSMMWGIPGYLKKTLQKVDAKQTYQVCPKLIIVNGVINPLTGVKSPQLPI